MEKAKNMSLDALAVGTISTGVAMVSQVGDKWYVGLLLIAVGVGLSYMKYHLRNESE